jgi:hypothetical protein
MNIYELKNDALGAYHDALDLAALEVKGSKRRLFYLAQARAFKTLHEVCAGWVGKQSPEEYLKDELLDLPTRVSNAVYRALVEPGYEL